MIVVQRACSLATINLSANRQLYRALTVVDGEPYLAFHFNEIALHLCHLLIKKVRQRRCIKALLEAF